MFYRSARLVTSVLTVAAMAAGSLAATSPAFAASNSSQCAQVHVFAARGSAEPPGPGAIQSLVDLVKSHSDQTVSSNAIDYPALLFPYGRSSASGTAAVKQQVSDQVEKCPRQKIVLVGYSQGAHIIGDALGGGGGGDLGPETPELDASIGDHVTAVIQMGDPGTQRGSRITSAPPNGTASSRDCHTSLCQPSPTGPGPTATTTARTAPAATASRSISVTSIGTALTLLDSSFAKSTADGSARPTRLHPTPRRLLCTVTVPCPAETTSVVIRHRLWFPASR